MKYTTIQLFPLIAGMLLAGCNYQSATGAELTDEQVEDLVRRSYQYVAMYNVINKTAADQVGGWNKTLAMTELLDHTVQVIARPNNDTLYIASILDLRKEPVILAMPAFDSKYVSLLVSGYDHYVTIPLASRLGDFKKPTKILFYTARTEGYDGEAVEGIDKVIEATGDFIQTTVRVMPHAGEPERFKRIIEQIKSFKLLTLSEYLGEKAKPTEEVAFPAVGETDADIFENNLLEVMQFVFNHTTFDEGDELDRALLKAYEPLGVAPGREFDANQVAKIDGKRFRAVAERVFKEEMARSTDPAFAERQALTKFLPKGEMELDIQVFQSVLGPVGVPAVEAVYVSLETADGKPMNANHDYVIRMAAEDMPPVGAFWSMTLYDFDRGFFIPNDRKKYSVGENGGMKLAEDGSIEVHIAAKKPEGVPEENWLPISRKDEAMDVVLRIYAPDLEKFKTWTPPKAEKLK